MRLKRGRCACLAFWLPADGPDAGQPEVAPPGSREFELVRRPPPRPPSGASISSVGSAQDLLHSPTKGGDADEELFRRTLRLLELVQEAEVMSTLGSDVDLGDLPDVDAEASEGRSDERRTSVDSLAPTSSLGLGQSLSRPLTRELTPPPSSPRGAFSVDELRSILLELRYRQLPSESAALQFIEQVKDHLRSTCRPLMNLKRPPGRLIIVGDIHGHLSDLLHILDKHGDPSETNQYLFNGDFVDRGVWGPEVLFSLFCLRLLHPESIFLNRGNHESELCTEVYGFKSQLACAFPGVHEVLYAKIQDCFDLLPLCYVVGGAVCVVHGGLPRGRPKPPKVSLPPAVTLKEIAALPRGPVPYPGEGRKDRIFQALLWSDPKEEERESYRGLGWHFSEETTRRFLQTNNLRCIVRSHECHDNGWSRSHGGLVLTVFSASNYDNCNQACVAIVDSSLDVQIGDTWTEPYMKAEWLLASLQQPVEDPDAWLRRTSSALWDDTSADRRAVAALRQRLGEVEQWACSAKERVMEELRSMIFLKRPDLCTAFTQTDKLEARRSAGGQRQSEARAIWVGRISPDRWAETMAATLRTPAGFPWRELGPYLYTLEEDGRVAYVDFLIRYHNPFSTWLSRRWCNSMLDQMVHSFGGQSCDEFDRWDLMKVGRLSYNRLQQMFQEHLVKIQASSHMEALQRSLHFFVLFAHMDTGHKEGCVTKEEFIQAFNRKTATAMQCPKGHGLEPHALKFWQGHIHIRCCDGCGDEIQRGQLRRCCEFCGYDLCLSCVAKREQVDRRRLDSAIKRGELHEIQWHNVESALYVLSASHCDVRALFRGVGKDGDDGAVDHDKFVAVVRDLLRGNSEAAEDLYVAMREYLEEEFGLQNDKFEVSHLVWCLRIIDDTDPQAGPPRPRGAKAKHRG